MREEKGCRHSTYGVGLEKCCSSCAPWDAAPVPAHQPPSRRRISPSVPPMLMLLNVALSSLIVTSDHVSSADTRMTKPIWIWRRPGRLLPKIRYHRADLKRSYEIGTQRRARTLASRHVSGDRCTHLMWSGLACRITGSYRRLSPGRYADTARGQLA
jgi:hypothetical protein